MNRIKMERGRDRRGEDVETNSEWKRKDRENRRNREVTLVDESKQISSQIPLSKITANYFVFYHMLRDPGWLP